MKKHMLKKSLALALAFVMVLSTMLIALAAKPNDGTTVNQPFPSGTAGSTNFRIPAMVALKDGTIVAATDARWNTTGDGGGLDTIVAYSKNGGANWTNTIANYLGDNGNVWNNMSTSFIDPALATDGSKVYMIVDLFPAGYALNSTRYQPSAGAIGFDANGNLRLSDNSRLTYNFYLKDGRIYKNDNTDTGHTVDEYFYLDGTDVNLFFDNSPYKVYPTNYLYLTSSEDGGAHWSAPTLINVKKANEQTCLIGPGTGIVTSTGRVMFAVYNYTNGDKNSSVIYSDDGGKTWTRSEDVTSQSSEATLVEADGRIYMFTRHGGYYVSENNGVNWSAKKSISGISYDTGCQINAVKYSKKIDGQTAILLSAPSNNRTNGKIYTLLVNADGSLSWKYTYNVNTGNSPYAYSSIAELPDSRVALLYESAAAAETFKLYNIETIAQGAEIGEPKVSVTDNVVTVTAPGLNSLTAASKAATAVPYSVNVVSYDVAPKTSVGSYTGAAAVSIAVPAGWGNTQNVRGYYMDGGKPVIVEGTLANGALSFNVPSFTAAGAEVGLVELDGDMIYKNIVLRVGEKETLTETGDFSSSPIINSNESIASAALDNVQVETKWVIGNNVDSSHIDGDPKRYVFKNQEGNYYLTGDTNGSGLKLISIGTEAGTAIPANALWSISYQGGSAFRLYNLSQKAYLTIGEGSSSLTSVASNVNMSQNGNVNIYTGNNDYRGTFLNRYGGGDSTTAAGWKEGNIFSATAKNGNGSKWLIYEANEVPTGNAASTYTFTANKAGVTTVIVGNIHYTVTVKDYPSNVTLGETPFTSGISSFAGRPVTKVNLSSNITYTPGVNGTATNWISKDPNVARVDPVTGTITAGNAGETIIIATVNGVEYALPVVVQPNGSTSGKWINVYIDAAVNTDVYYSLSATNGTAMDTAMYPAQAGEDFAYCYPSNYRIALDFFGAPQKGYALTYLSATNADGNYTALDGDVAENTKFYNSDPAATQQKSVFNTDDVLQMVRNALEKDCDGGLGYTRNTSGGNINPSSLTFRSEKLPEITKNIVALRHAADAEGNKVAMKYEDGMAAVVGDEVFYEVVVKKEAYQDLINFVGMSFKDSLDVTFYDYNDPNQIFPVMPTESANDAASFPDDRFSKLEADEAHFYIGYVIKESDLDKEIKNTVDLTYNYSSQYSNGSFSESSEAVASITVAPFKFDDIVLDFGLPTSAIDCTEKFAASGAKIVSGSALYADIEVLNGGKAFRYVPNQIMQGVDDVSIMVTYGNDTVVNVGFRVYPATTVYYEEGFALLNGFDSQGSKGVLTQTLSATKSKANYGYEASYLDNKGTPSNNSEAVSKTYGANAEFTFAGTGVDIYTNNTPDTGVICVLVKDNETGAFVRIYNVDTQMKDGATGATASQAVNAYNVPVVSITDLAPNSYTVYIYHLRRDADPIDAPAPEIKLDGYRVYGGAIDDDSSTVIYNGDGERAPKFIELRDKVIAGNIAQYEMNKGQYIDEETGEIFIDQVYNYVSGSYAAILDDNGYDENAMNDLIANGPKNEIYLQPGQTLMFTVKRAGDVQVGLKSLSDKAAEVQLNGANVDISSVDMFYKLTVAANGTVTITNTGDGILSVTKVKLFSTNDLAPIAKANVAMALMAMGYEFEAYQAPEAPETPDAPDADNNAPDTPAVDNNTPATPGADKNAPADNKADAPADNNAKAPAADANKGENTPANNNADNKENAPVDNAEVKDNTHEAEKNENAPAEKADNAEAEDSDNTVIIAVVAVAAVAAIAVVAYVIVKKKRGAK